MFKVILHFLTDNALHQEICIYNVDALLLFLQSFLTESVYE